MTIVHENEPALETVSLEEEAHQQHDVESPKTSADGPSSPSQEELIEDVESPKMNEDGASSPSQEELIEDVESPKTNEEPSPQEEEISEEERRLQRYARNKKIAIGLVFLAFIIFVIVDSTTTGYLRSGIDTALKWIEANAVAGMFVFMLIYFVATVIFLPGSLLTLGAGFVFANAFGLGLGLLIGVLSVFVGASAGAIVAFLLGRYLLRDSVKSLADKYAVFEALDIALQEKGLRIMTLLRLSPIIPFNAVNYIAGVTSISFFNYCIALLAILPGTTLYVFLGASAGSLADSASSGDNATVTIIVIVVGAVFGIFAIVLTSIYAKRELNRVIAQRQEAETTQGSEDNEDDADGDIEAQVLDEQSDKEDKAMSTDTQDEYSPEAKDLPETITSSMEA